MPTITLNLTVEQFARHHGRLATQLLPAVHRGLRSGIMRALVMLQRKTREAGPAGPVLSTGGAVDTGSFLRGWKTRPTPTGGVLENVAPHSAVVEEGRRPNRRAPPSQVMYEWARRRLGLSDQEARRVAFLMARAVGRRGLRGRHILRDNMEEVLRLVEQEVQREVQKELSRI
jgi:hypothetical protein